MIERAAQRPGLIAAALARAEAFLLEPPDAMAASPPPGARPVVAVAAAGPRCGRTTVARGLAAELAARDVTGAAAVAGPVERALAPLGLPAASRLARSAEQAAGGRARIAGRLCLVEGGDPVALAAGLRHTAPVVLEVPAGDPRIASLADVVLLVAAPHVEPALASVLAKSLARAGPQPLLVLNRAPLGAEPSRWQVLLPESRPGARSARAGCAPPGRLGRALAHLADVTAA